MVKVAIRGGKLPGFPMKKERLAAEQYKMKNREALKYEQSRRRVQKNAERAQAHTAQFVIAQLIERLKRSEE